MKALFFNLIRLACGLIAIAILAGACCWLIPQVLSPDHSRAAADMGYSSESTESESYSQDPQPYQPASKIDDKPFLP